VPAGVLRAALGELSQLILEGQKVLPTKALSAGFAFRYPELKAALAELLRAKDPAVA
jgi:NAD dependent epimerase/dehydratase family enzyme